MGTKANRNKKTQITSVKVKKDQKVKKIKIIDCDSDSSSDSVDSIRLDLWQNAPDCVSSDSEQNLEIIGNIACTKKKSPKKICIVVENCDPICADICLQKNLLTVCRVPLASAIALFYESGSMPDNTYFSQLVLTYEIVIVNKTSNKIANISIFDSLAGITFEENGSPYMSQVSVVKCPGNITLYEMDEIAARKGLLNNPEGSYLPPNSVTKIILKLALGAPPGGICEVRYVQNSVCFEGLLEASSCKGNKVIISRKPIKPITEISNIWQTDSDISFLIIGTPIL